jgi:hypothetical protein
MALEICFQSEEAAETFHWAPKTMAEEMFPVCTSVGIYEWVPMEKSTRGSFSLLMICYLNTASQPGVRFAL